MELKMVVLGGFGKWLCSLLCANLGILWEESGLSELSDSTLAQHFLWEIPSSVLSLPNHWGLIAKNRLANQWPAKHHDSKISKFFASSDIFSLHFSGSFLYCSFASLQAFLSCRSSHLKSRTLCLSVCGSSRKPRVCDNRDLASATAPYLHDFIIADVFCRELHWQKSVSIVRNYCLGSRHHATRQVSDPSSSLRLNHTLANWV